MSLNEDPIFKLNQPAKLRIELEKAIARNQHLEEEVSRLYEIIGKLKREAFGPKKERWENPEQLVFNEAEILAKNAAPEAEDQAVEVDVPGHTRKARGHRKALPKELPREIQVVALPVEEQVDENGTKLKAVGKEVSEKLVFEPAVMKVLEIHRIKYGYDAGEVVKTAPSVASIIPKGIATASLLADIVVKKYADGLPLYRQEEIYKRFGIDIPRSSQSRWIVQAAEACRPILNVLNDRLMSSPYVSCDETRTQVLNEKGRVAESQSWMWVRCTPSGDHRIAIFEYDPSRSAAVASRLFADYRGILQVDGFASYNDLEKQEGLTRIGCNMHGRRKFFDASKGSKQGQSLADQGLLFYQQLYAIEEKAKELTWAERHELRARDAVPIWAEFKSWADEQARKVPPKSKIGMAFHYFHGEYEYLIGYLRDGRLEMDNGFAERVIKYFAIGRNNWLFSATPEGAEASALFYSLITTIKINRANPYEIMKKVFEEVPKAQTIEDFERIADLLVARQPRH